MSRRQQSSIGKKICSINNCVRGNGREKTSEKEDEEKKNNNNEINRHKAKHGVDRQNKVASQFCRGRMRFDFSILIIICKPQTYNACNK